jgi:hypothetical protein
MFGSGVLDVAVGLLFLYLLLGVFCSAACELVETVWRGRARLLHRSLRQMLNDPEGRDIVPAIYGHPLVNSLFSGRYSATYLNNLPSYIPAETFAIALMDIMGASGRNPYAYQSSGYGSEASSSFAGSPSGFNSYVDQALRSLSDPEYNDPARLRQAIVKWYNTTMERTTGTYKRQTQVILLCLGGALAAGLNADTFTVANSLATDSAVRQVLVASVIDHAKGAGTDATQGFVTWDLLQQIRVQSPPLGLSSMAENLRGATRPLNNFWFHKMVGLLLTTLAILFTAPLCFDTLGRIMMVRSAVRPKISEETKFREDASSESVSPRFPAPR